MPDTSATTSSAKSVHATSPPAKPEVTDQSLLGQRSFLAYLGARCVSEYAYQIATVAIGWQIYELTGSAFQLGMVGLVQFIPSALLVFAAGHGADRYGRPPHRAALPVHRGPDQCRPGLGHLCRL